MADHRLRALAQREREPSLARAAAAHCSTLREIICQYSRFVPQQFVNPEPIAQNVHLLNIEMFHEIDCMYNDEGLKCSHSRPCYEAGLAGRASWAGSVSV